MKCLAFGLWCESFKRLKAGGVGRRDAGPKVAGKQDRKNMANIWECGSRGQRRALSDATFQPQFGPKLSENWHQMPEGGETNLQMSPFD